MNDIANCLNIFTDASIINRSYGFDGCYGAIAIYQNNIIDSIVRVNTNTTNNNAEIKGLRAGVLLALKHNSLETINIFSDSQISVFGIRDRLLTWKLFEGSLYGKQGQVIQSQSVYTEIVYLILNAGIHINFFHQKGHVSVKKIDSLMNAQKVFADSNGYYSVDINLIRYISKWNDIIDNTTREQLFKTTSGEYRDMLFYYPTEINKIRYRDLTKINI